MTDPKYTLREIERRWLARKDLLPDLDEKRCWIVTDKYFDMTRIRLRKMEDPAGVEETVFKLCKKYGKVSPMEEPITNIYLTEEEFNLLNRLEGKLLVRKRYPLTVDGQLFILCEVIEGHGPAIIEAEFRSAEEAVHCIPPEFAGEEVGSRVEMEAVRFAK